MAAMGLWRYAHSRTEEIMLASIDHIVLTTADLERCLDFYTRVLGMTIEHYGAGRIALKFGPHKFNVHPPGFNAGIKARVPTPGSLDLCFLADRPLDQVIAHLNACNVTIEEGPSVHSGARFQIRSVYIRDPDGNLIEISERADA
jgi:catechol 2,3-dioxygenase-like lactoylglutathione lyase family enzyme